MTEECLTQGFGEILFFFITFLVFTTKRASAFGAALKQSGLVVEGKDLLRQYLNEQTFPAVD